MTRTRFACATLMLVALAGCQREQAAPAAADTAPVAQSPAPSPAPASAAPAPAATPQPTDAIETVATPPADASFDKRAFAGTFSAGSTRLELKPDGAYVLDAAGAVMDGTWTTESGDKHVRLDPNSKTEADRLFAIAGKDELSPLSADGKPAATGDATPLKRSAP